MSITAQNYWNLPDIVQPAEGSGLPLAMTEVRPGCRYQFMITGTVQENAGARHLCKGANLEITDDYGKVHFFDGSSLQLRAGSAVKGWPPQEGDTWEDEHGELWFAFRLIRSSVLELKSAHGDGMLAHGELALRMKLAFRREPPL